MSLLRSRAKRAKSYWRLILAVVAGATTLVGVGALSADRYGGRGVIALSALIVAGFLASLLLPDGAWSYLTGEDRTPDDLGELHEEGVSLRRELPWVTDEEAGDELGTYKARVEDWATRVLDRLPPRWRGTFLTAPTGMRTSTTGYVEASRIRNWFDDRLERLSQIMSSIGGR